MFIHQMDVLGRGQEHRAQTPVKASVTAGRRAARREKLPLTPLVVICHRQRSAAREGARDVQWQPGCVREPLQRSDLKAEQKTGANRMFPSRFLNRSQTQHMHMHTPPLASALMSLVQSPSLSLCNTRKQGIPAFICTGASICTSKKKSAFIPIFPPPPSRRGSTSVEQVRSPSGNSHVEKSKGQRHSDTEAKRVLQTS